MKLYLFFCLLLLSACHSILPNSHLSDKEAKEEIDRNLKGNNLKDRSFPEPLIADEETAIKVTEAILFKYFGEEQIKSERPYTIRFADGYWVMFGTLHATDGGAFEIIIDSKNGQVVDLSHGK
jgi:hypothetical protein